MTDSALPPAILITAIADLDTTLTCISEGEKMIYNLFGSSL